MSKNHLIHFRAKVTIKSAKTSVPRNASNIIVYLSQSARFFVVAPIPKVVNVNPLCKIASDNPKPPKAQYIRAKAKIMAIAVDMVLSGCSPYPQLRSRKKYSAAFANKDFCLLAARASNK